MEICQGVPISYRYQQSEPQSVRCGISDQLLVRAHNAPDSGFGHFAGFLHVAPHEVRNAFEVLGNARRLAAIFEAFLGGLDRSYTWYL